MTATLRRHVAAAFDHWHKAVEIRQDWLGVGLSTEPADRAAAEQILTRLYHRHGRGRPAFVWVDSPPGGAAQATDVPHHDEMRAWLRPDSPPGRPPVAIDIAAGWSRMMAVLDEGAAHPDLSPVGAVRKGDKPWPVLPPEQAISAGVPLRLVLRQGVRDALRTALMDSVALRARAALGPVSRVPVCWYGQQDAYWIAHYDTLRRLGLAHYPQGAAERLDDWIALARVAGWWWPGEQVCVLADRPASIGPVALPADAIPSRSTPAVVYRDGWHIP